MSAALLLMLMSTNAALPAAIAFIVVGVVLVAVSRR